MHEVVRYKVTFIIKEYWKKILCNNSSFCNLQCESQILQFYKICRQCLTIKF